ncbi:MAG TPA: hypothetical protein VHY79_20170 [Rhizomicrobium sp.]|jgi:hypothetical protein|nr:hypothetical protein [Rhizomicrobium sp.]
MSSELPNIEKLRVELPSTLHLKFHARRWRAVNLAGLIAREKFLAALRDREVFARASIVDWGAGVGWPDDRDLSASTLWRMSEEQAPFTYRDFGDWQLRLGLSNQEAADALGLSLRTIKNIRGGIVPVSHAVSIACRAMESDPTILAAHYAPRRPGRPKAT